jgi:hypothetical protein
MTPSHARALVRRQRSVDKGMCGHGIEPRNQTLWGAGAVKRGGRPHGTSAVASSRPAHAVEDPSPVRKLSAREPGEPCVARPGWRGGRLEKAKRRHADDARRRAVGQARSPDEADEQSREPGRGIGGGKGSDPGDTDGSQARRTQSRTHARPRRSTVYVRQRRRTNGYGSPRSSTT